MTTTIILVLLIAIAYLGYHLVNAAKLHQRDNQRIDQLQKTINNYRYKLDIMERAWREMQTEKVTGITEPTDIKAAREKVNAAYSRAIDDWERRFGAKSGEQARANVASNMRRQSFETPPTPSEAASWFND